MKKTAILLTAIMITLGIYDAYVVTFSGVDASISRYLQQTMFSSPIFSFGLGAIFGHVALYFRPKWQNSELLIKEMADRLVELEEVGFEKKRGYYWLCNGEPLKGQS